MGRLGSALAAGIAVSLVALLSGCSSSSPTTNAPPPVPQTIVMTPSPTASVELGKILTFTATPQDASAAAISETVSYQSSNTAVITISTGGLACAGSWDSLTVPQICTPGPTGVAQITANVRGVSSPPTTVYVHQHIDNVSLSPVPAANAPVQTCYSKDQTFVFQATASSRGTDITSSVGPFTWTGLNQQVLTLKAPTLAAPITGLANNQVQATAGTPGLTTFFASVDNITSVPMQFVTCPVQSITLSVQGSNVTAAPITISQGSSLNINTTVTDIRGTVITDVPLTWCSSAPAVATAAAANCTTSTANPVSATNTQSGGASLLASCEPPTCNIGIAPSLPVYSTNVVNLLVSPNSTTTATASTVWVTTTRCGTLDGCITVLMPITSGSSTTPGSAGTGIGLPATPNSLVFNPAGTKAYLGTDKSNLKTRGLMVLDPAGATVSQFAGVAGKVLAVSPDGNKVIVSDTADTPNQVVVFDTSTNTADTFLINGATVAGFSPDGLKAFIVAGSTLYIYSKQDALETIALAAAPTDVAFLANGIFGYLTNASGISFLPVCDDPATPSIGTVGLSGATLIRALPDGRTMLTYSAAGGVRTFTADVSGAATPGALGCPTPRGFLTVAHAVNSSAISLGQGNLPVTQVLISSDGQKAYFIAQNSGTIVVLNIPGRTTSLLALANNAGAVQASLSPDNTRLFVAATDGTVHLIDLNVGSDFQQVSIPNNVTPPSLNGGLCANVNFVCGPDLIAVQP